MRLALYSSKSGGSDPNLVAIQDLRFHRLPTLLVCPTKPDATRTSYRAEIVWRDKSFVVLCELARPIHRDALRLIGEASEADSRAVMTTFLKLLAKD